MNAEILPAAQPATTIVGMPDARTMPLTALARTGSGADALRHVLPGGTPQLPVCAFGSSI
jgi:hypothetical protein